MKRIKTALIGCGKVGGMHAQVLSTLPESNFVAVCDASEERSGEFASRFDVRGFTDVGSLVKESGAEAVVVATPHPLHAEATIQAADAGVHVLIEKPMSSSLDDCDRMLAAGKRSGVTIGVVSQRRFSEPVLRMRRAIDEGKLGKPILGVALMFNWRDEAYYRSDPWRGKWATEGGGVLVNQAPHHLDLLQWFMGPIVEICGNWANLNHPYIEVEDTAIANIRFASGGLGSVVVSLSQKPGLFSKVHVHGSNGASVGVETDRGATFIAGMSGIAEPPLNDLWTIPGEESSLSEFQVQDRNSFSKIDPNLHYHSAQVSDFLQALIHDRAPTVTGEDGRIVTAMFTAIYRSQTERRPIPFEELIGTA